MVKKRLLVLSITLLLMVACIIPTPAANQGSNSGGPVVNGSGGFSAQATSANSVLLTWPAAAGAQKYLLDVQVGRGDFLQTTELNADQTTYEDVGVPEALQLTYRLRAQTSSGTSAGDTVTITTPEATPDPLTVQANEYKPITWTPPTPDPNHPVVDPSTYFPPGYDPAHPENFDPSMFMQPVRASADIGQDGGVISVTTPDNITYQLTIPTGALEESMTIDLVPIETIDSLPFTGGLQGAVRIEPEGLLLDLPANLTITRADAAPLPDGMIDVAFAFDGMGGEFHLYPFGTGEQTTSRLGAGHTARLAAVPPRAGPLGGLSISDLRTYGAATGTPQQAAAVVKKTPTAAEDRLLNQLAYGQDTEDELGHLVSKRSLATAKLLERAQLNAPDWEQMTIELSQLDILMKYYGKDPSLKGDLAKILDLLAERLSTMLKYNLENCLTGDDYYVQAVVGTILGGKPGSMYDSLRKKLDPQVLKDVAEMRKKCILSLTIDSEINEDDGVSAKTNVQVSGRIDQLKFHFSNGQVFLSGEGVLHYSHVEIFPHKQPKYWCDPWIPDNVDSVTGRVNVTRLDLTFAKVPGGTLQTVKLTRMTVRDSAGFKGIATCTTVGNDGKLETNSVYEAIPAAGSLWHGYFIASHMSNRVIEFRVQPAANRPLNGSAQPIIATFDSEQPSFSPGYGTWSESSKFELVDATPK